MPDLGHRPFCGTVLGIEVALLDLVSRAQGRALHEVLGTQRPVVPIVTQTLSTVTVRQLSDRFLRRVRRHAEKYGAIRLKGFGDVERDLKLLAAVGQELEDLGRDTVVWIDQNGGLSDEQAGVFIDRLAALMRDGSLPHRLILEQPVSSSSSMLPTLQRQADAVVAAPGDLRVMADESLWEVADYKQVAGRRGCRAINIKTPKTGGLLAALDLVNLAAKSGDVQVYIGGMLGASDITTWTHIHLAMAARRIDYSTAVPPVQVEQRFVRPLARFEAEATRLSVPEGHGLGAVVDAAQLLPYIVRQAMSPPAEPLLLAGRTPNDYSDIVAGVRRFGRYSLDSHVLEREAIQRGLGTHRISPIELSVDDAAGRCAGFSWSKSVLTSRSAGAMTVDKESTRTLLSRAGVPTPAGRSFSLDDSSGAEEYADSIGFPVVVKPVAGTGGRGVFTELRSREDVREAFAKAAASADVRHGLIVETHVAGDSYRVFVIGDEVISAIRWHGTVLVGDGRSTVAELASARNSFRRTSPYLSHRLAKFDVAGLEALARQGIGPDSVPAQAQRVELTLHPQGGENEEVVHEMHPSIKRIAVNALRAIPGLAYSGIDIIAQDHREPAQSQNVSVIELNSSPALTSAEYPALGPRHPVAGRIIEECIERVGLDATPLDSGSIEVVLTVNGFFVGGEYRAWVADRATELEIEVCDVRSAHGSYAATVAGRSSDLAILASHAIIGPPDARPTRVSTVPVRWMTAKDQQC
ncbi:enolase C-terminal domain-like protein [Ilumatobacter nonamiensis]|uniref:enolase C-terminal domain-like protein n=1 Tax=Ilumatobacter nonamiensis TaxID=467093 RepID=UPI00130DB54A|nr:enolase C-terminal domain-like protein [Ilumatobacter nonamiensis]